MNCQLVIYLLLGLMASAWADLYMHSFRGSNDRLNEASQNRANDNRLFNSQNNGEGGYCWGPPLKFYEGSHSTIEWTNQHSCGNDNSQCNLIIQYMCSDTNGNANYTIRDGQTTTSPPTGAGAGDPASGQNYFNYMADPTTGQYFYGMHESYDYYTKCVARQRNQGLFVADQNVNNNGAQSTRQNQNGGVSGYECQEERDYYPYWHPSPWKDIAILTTQTSNCGYYKSQSQNVMSKNYCWGNTQQAQAANNQNACNLANGQWMTVPSWGIKAPVCQAAPWGRDNHLGNGVDGHQQHFNWTLPKKGVESCIATSSCNCVLRMRYNISTSETNNWGSNAADWKTSGVKSPIKQDPFIMLTSSNRNLSLALNTNQYGRTFQDRSHMWNLVSRPHGVSSSANIWNLNVRGKRGNIVQVYPATEYDFTPTDLAVTVGDYVHYQWTGCDTNPAGNAGEGIDQTDRSNIVQVRGRTYNYPLMESDYSASKITPMFDSAALRDNMAFIGQTDCLSYADLMSKNNNNKGQVEVDPQNCGKLNAAATPYFDAGLVKMNKTGTFHYMSSRNNNFTNRSQKGTMIVKPLLPPWGVALVVIGSVAAVSVGAAAGAVIYSKRNPHSRIAGFVGKVPLINRI